MTIDLACQKYLRNQPRRRPTPGDIRAIAAGTHQRGPNSPKKGGSRQALSHDELALLETQIIPTAQRWVREIPELAAHGRATLDYWGVSE